MKKGLLLAILAALTSLTLVGCGQQSGDQQSTDDSANTAVSTEEQKTEENSDEPKNEGATEEPAEEKAEENTEEKKDDNSQSIGLDEKTIEGESVEGKIYGTGKYRLTKGSDRVVVEWVKDNSKNKIEYIFSDDKLSDIMITATYENDDQAKSTYDSIMKSGNAKKGIKDIQLEGNRIIYKAEDSQWSEIKDYTKDQIFDEQKKTLDELSKVDDIKSDD